MRVLLCKTGHRMEQMVKEGLLNVEIEVIELCKNPAEKEYEVEYVQELTEYIREQKIDMLWSIGYFPALSRGCAISRVPYIAWEIGESWNTLYSETIKSPWNYIFIAEERIAERFWKKNPGHIFSLQPGVNLRDRSMQSNTVCLCNTDSYPVYYLKNNYSWYAKGYTRGLIEAQQRVYGYHFLPKLINGKYRTEMGKVLSEPYRAGDYSKKKISVMLDDFLCDTITQNEREEVSNRIKALGLYSETEVPAVNVCIPSRKCRTGIPYEMLLTMAAGGFILTGYQEGIAAGFNLGEELIVYEDMKDMEEKVKYYLEHEEEREAIAEKGRIRVENDFRLEDRLEEIFYAVTEGMKHIKK